MTSEEIRENEAYINKLKRDAERAEKLEQLESNELFKEVIMEGYLREELDKLVALQNFFAINATPTTVEFGKEQDKLTQRQIEAIGLFKYFIDTIKKQGREAKETLKAIDESNNKSN